MASARSTRVEGLRPLLPRSGLREVRQSGALYEALSPPLSEPPWLSASAHAVRCLHWHAPPTTVTVRSSLAWTKALQESAWTASAAVQPFMAAGVPRGLVRYTRYEGVNVRHAVNN